MISKQKLILHEILESDDVVESIRSNIEILTLIIPEIKNMIGFDHKHPHHHLDVFEHTLYALSMSSNDFEIRLSLLLHDIGKPFSFIEGDIRHFNGHPKVSENITRDILNRLNFEKEFIDRICFFVLNHDNIITTSLIKEDYEKASKLFQIQRCDALAHHPDKLEKRIKYLKILDEKLKKNKS